MKTCANCGVQNADEAERCQACSTTTFVSSSPEAIGGHVISPAEQRFWQRITFRQFAVVFVRMQAVWFIFYTFYNLTYLPTYFPHLGELFSSSHSRPMMDTRGFMEILRLLMNLAGAMVCIQFADPIVSWLVRDMVPSQPPASPQAALNVPSRTES